MPAEQQYHHGLRVISAGPAGDLRARVRTYCPWRNPAPGRSAFASVGSLAGTPGFPPRTAQWRAGMRSRLDGGNRVVEVDRGQRKCLARAGFTIVPGLSHPIEWECDCGCRIPLSVLQPAGDGFDQALAAFLAWLSSNGHALRGGNLDLRPEDAAALSGLAGEPLVDLRYRYDGRDVGSVLPSSRRSWCMRLPPSASWLPAVPCPTSLPWSPAGSPTCGSSASCRNSPAAWRHRYWPRRRARKCRSPETRAQCHGLTTTRNPSSPCPAVPSAPRSCNS